jgi:uncharacterized membrane protein
MSDLVVIAFKEETTADQARAALDALEEGEVVGLNDLVVVRRDPDGKVHMEQHRRHAGTKIVGGAFWGLLIGLLFFVPGLGLIIGGLIGGGIAMFRDVGVSDDFIKETAQTITPGTSALFLMVTSDPGQILARLKEFGGKVISTSLSKEQEDRMKLLYGSE